MGRRKNRPPSMDRKDTPLARAIKHYRQAVKEATGNAAHYALGALEVLMRVKELRDAYRDDMRQAWVDRASDGGNRYYGLRSVAVELDNIMLNDDESPP